MLARGAAAITRIGGRRGVVWQVEGDSGIGHVVEGVRGPAIVLEQAVGGLVAGRGVGVGVGVSVLLLLRRDDAMGAGVGMGLRVLWGCRYQEARADPEGQLGLGMLGLVRRVVEILSQGRLEVFE